MERQNREIHDRIQEEEKSLDKKKKYLEDLRKVSQRKEIFSAKKEILEKMVGNTEKLRRLKKELEGMETLPEMTFLTL